MEERSDTELMALLKEGDYRAFDALYSRYREPIQRFLYSLSGDRQAAEDGLQEVFLRLFRARRRYAPTGCFRAYLFRIARNYHLWQKRRSRALGETPLEERDEAGHHLGDALFANRRVEPEYHLLEAYRLWRIRRAIRDLPETQKTVFVLAQMEGMKYAEIAVILGVPVGTVKSRMFAAVRTLQSKLGELY